MPFLKVFHKHNYLLLHKFENKNQFSEFTLVWSKVQFLTTYIKSDVNNIG